MNYTAIVCNRFSSPRNAAWRILPLLTIIGIVGVLIVQTASGRPQRVPHADVSPVLKPPVIDGRLDDSCWRSAPRLSGFVTVEKTWPQEQTTAYVTCDRKKLYLAVVCRERQPSKIKAAKQQHDADIWADDCIEIFLSPDHDGDTYYHFIVNSRGTAYEACNKAGADVCDPAWNPVCEVAASVGDESWQVELAIPFKSLGVTVPKSEAIWGFNVSRERWVSGEGEFSSWAMTRKFDDPSAFGEIRFGAPQTISWSIASIGTAWGANTLVAMIHNGKTVPVDVQMKVEVVSPVSFGETKRVVAGALHLEPQTERNMVVVYHVAAVEGKGDLEIGLFAGNGTEPIEIRRAGFSVMGPLNLEMSSYYTELESQRLQVMVKLADKIKAAWLSVGVHRDVTSEFLTNQTIALSPEQRSYPFVTELRKANDYIKSLDKNHLTAFEVDVNDLKTLAAYKDCSDIIEVVSCSYAKDLIPELANNVEKIRCALGDSKPFLFWIGSSVPAEEKRNAEVIRCAVYLALMHGAKGLVFHTGYKGIKAASTRHWSVYRGLAREVEALFPILLEPVPTAAACVTVDSPDIDFCLREFHGRTYLIACNTREGTIPAAFRCAAWPSDGVVKLPFENRQVRLTNGAFVDGFTIYEPHVYLLPLFSIAKVLP